MLIIVFCGGYEADVMNRNSRTVGKRSQLPLLLRNRKISIIIKSNACVKWFKVVCTGMCHFSDI